MKVSGWLKWEGPLGPLYVSLEDIIGIGAIKNRPGTFMDVENITTITVKSFAENTSYVIFESTDFEFCKAFAKVLAYEITVAKEKGHCVDIEKLFLCLFKQYYGEEI